MTKPRQCFVVTTINHPTPALREIARAIDRRDMLVIVGDETSPSDFDLPGSTYLDVSAQVATGFLLARVAPTRHYARKNVGYLFAIRSGAGVLIETDDDNLPQPSFWAARTANVEVPCLRDQGWVNVYRYFTDQLIWPRGLPLDSIHAPVTDLAEIAVGSMFCPIQQGLADIDPDVDALYRLIVARPLRFEPGRSLALARGSWCPFNSQNTSWWPQCFALLYLPSFCSFRMTDIWRSFIAQRILHANGFGVLYTSASVAQDRNQHDLNQDFALEVPGYLHNKAMMELLVRADVRPGIEHMGFNLYACYEVLVAGGYIPAEELSLVRAWLSDLAMLDLGPPGHPTAPVSSSDAGSSFG